jgi:general secretion pathway protein D
MSKLFRNLLPITLALLLAGCANERVHQEGLALINEGRLEEGLAMLQQAQQIDPGNATLRKDWLIQRDFITQRILAEGNVERSAEHWDIALQRYNRVLRIQPTNQAAQQAVTEITLERKQSGFLDEADQLIKKGDFDSANGLIVRVLVENPQHVRAQQLRARVLAATQNDSLNSIALNLKGRKPVTLQFRDANLRMVMEAIAKTTGLNILFDKDVKPDLKVTIFVRDTPVEEAIDLILMQTQTTKRILGENSLVIYSDTDSKAKEYSELKIRRFALTNADPKQVMAMVKTMAKTKDMFIDEKTNALVVRDTPQVIRLVEKLIVSMDQPEAEVMLEVDVMEVSRDRMLELGIDLPTAFGAATNGMTLAQFRALGESDFKANGNILITARKTDSDINDLATPRIRVRNKEKAKFLVGDRLPVISTAAVPSTTATSAVYNTNVQYVEVGIKIEVEPTIYSDGEVAIRLALEVSSAGDPNAAAAATGTIAYPISTRSVNTVLRLKDGQTEIIGGLIQDQDRASASKIPGFGDIPILGRLFGMQKDTKNKKEVILSITPRIVRNNHQAEGELLEMWSGTENNFRYGNKTLGSPKLQAPAAALANPAAAPAGGATAPAPAAGAAAPTRANAVAAAAAARNAAAAASLAAARAAPRGVNVTAPASAKPGEIISASLSLPALTGAASLETGLTYDASRLRLLAVNDADAARSATTGARFAGDSDTPGTVQITLTAGRGETLPTGGGALAQVQFEVLAPLGITTLNPLESRADLGDNGPQSLPAAPALTLDVKAAP